MNTLLKIGLTVIALSAAQSAAALDLKSMSADEKAAFGDAVRSYLLENPEVIFEAVDVLKAQQAESEMVEDATLVEVNAQEIFYDGYSYVGGNPEGDITLVEFLDYRCGYCRKAHADVAKLLETDGNIRFVIKELPILGEASLEFSKFAVAVKQVHGNDAYGSVHEALMAYTGDPDQDTLVQLANTFGLDAPAILETMQSPAVLQEIAATQSLAQRLRINGTPTFVLQDELIRGYVPYDALKDIVAQKRD